MKKKKVKKLVKIRIPTKEECEAQRKRLDSKIKDYKLNTEYND